MIKTTSLLLIAGTMALAEDAGKMPDPQPSARSLTETEVLRIQKSLLKLKLLQQEYKIEEFQQRANVIATEQDAIISAACKSIGVAKENVKTQCVVSGFGNDGEPVVGPDGKPMPPRVERAMERKDKR